MMTKIGYTLLILGFLSGALVAVLDETTLNWTWFILALLVGIAGVVLLRISARQHARDESRLEAGIRTMAASLDAVVERLTAIRDAFTDGATYEMATRIDTDLRDDIAIFVDGRDTITHLYGLQAFGEVMSSFSAGERYANRVWSASADGYVDEVREYLTLSLIQMQNAQSRLRELMSPKS